MDSYDFPTGVYPKIIRHIVCIVLIYNNLKVFTTSNHTATNICIFFAETSLINATFSGKYRRRPNDQGNVTPIF